MEKAKKILLPSDMRGRQKRRETQAKASTKATDSQWMWCETGIKAWIKEYPHEWHAFQEEMKQGRNKYNDAKGGGLKKSQFRNTAAFPIAYKKVPSYEYNVDTQGEYPVAAMKYTIEEDSLLPVLKKIIPGLTDKKSVNYAEFLRRFPAFMPSEKSNTGEF